MTKKELQENITQAWKDVLITLKPCLKDTPTDHLKFVNTTDNKHKTGYVSAKEQEPDSVQLTPELIKQLKHLTYLVSSDLDSTTLNYVDDETTYDHYVHDVSDFPWFISNQLGTDPTYILAIYNQNEDTEFAFYSNLDPNIDFYLWFDGGEVRPVTKRNLKDWVKVLKEEYKDDRIDFTAWQQVWDEVIGK